MQIKSLGLIAEDAMHESFLTALTVRMSRELGLDIRLAALNSKGGLGSAKSAFKLYLRRFNKGLEEYHDGLVVAADCNCKGVNDRLAEFRGIEERLPTGILICYALPDPHIERWFLLDPTAFERVFGSRCTLPRYKCERDYYKMLVSREIRTAGINPILSGNEWVTDIVEASDLEAWRVRGDELGRFVGDLHSICSRELPEPTDTR